MATFTRKRKAASHERRPSRSFVVFFDITDTARQFAVTRDGQRLVLFCFIFLEIVVFTGKDSVQKNTEDRGDGQTG